MLRQISVFLENKKGRLAIATKLLGDRGIDLVALSIADTTDFGIMRCLVDRPDEAIAVLSENGFTASTTEVLAVPGAGCTRRPCPCAADHRRRGD